MIRVLVISGDYWHPTEVIRRGLLGLPDADHFQFDFITDAKDMLCPEMLGSYDVIVNAKMDVISEGNQHEWFQEGVTEIMPADLKQWTAAGHGFLALHGGSSYYNTDTTGYTDFVGCHFVTHPPRCAIDMKIVAEHPVTKDVPAFTYRDEHYQLALQGDDIQVLATSHSPTGGDQVGAYVRPVGVGRLCVLAPGHILQTFMHPAYQKMLSNALRWCAGE